MLRKTLAIIAISLLLSQEAFSQGAIRNDFIPAADSLRTLLQERTSVFTELKLERVLRRSSLLDFYFSTELGDYPWRSEDVDWFRRTLSSLFPDGYGQYSIGNVYCKRTNLRNYITPALSYNGKPVGDTYHYPAPKGTPLVRRTGAQGFSKGLSGRHIALWQSHGRYYEAEYDRWEWQRAPTQGTIEDIFTQGIVLPFLIPMLENSGAYVMTPRERDIQPYEVIIDNDPSFSAERSGFLRRSGKYSESGRWSDAGTGFADSKEAYMLGDEPFTMGSARQAGCTASARSGVSRANWDFTPPQRGSYAVYVSYKTVKNSTDAARYTVHHSGGTTEFLVNQRMGGGTWIYLGTFEFDQSGSVTLDNVYPSSGKMPGGAVVTADAVKIGGGVGKTLRGASGAPKSTYTTSGLPSYLEGALYWEQWAGATPEMTESWNDDYTKDYAGRGVWVSTLTGGSSVNPKMEGKGIPVDLSIAIHSDAGVTPNDSIVGTLAIYTLLSDGKSTYADGRSRYLARELSDIVQTQVCNDIRSEFNPDWTRRGIWDKSYSEARTTSVPGMILETLSHQNLADMEYGHNPDFKFTLARGVYKGILKFLSNEYNCDYAVQPLPVNSISARFASDGNVLIQWRPTVDTLEPTAVSSRYIIYTRMDDGSFDKGLEVKGDMGADGFVRVQLTYAPGHIYSYKVVAVNDGGMSFPSEIVSIGMPENSKGAAVMVINNFDRVAGPTWFDSPAYGGFQHKEDAGVGYLYDLEYAGDVYDFRRDSEWTDDDNPGWGGNSIEFAGTVVPGNTFDYAKVHGKALLAAGRPFFSASREGWTSDSSLAQGADAVDLICGKQVTTRTGPDRSRYTVFPVELQEVLRSFTDGGGDVLISGANIATDVWDGVYPVQQDSLYLEQTRAFVQDVLGYKLQGSHGSYTGIAATMDGARSFQFHQKRNTAVYNVENPDGISPANSKGRTYLRYTGNNVPAAVRYNSGSYKVASFGFPLETVVEEEDLDVLVKEALDYFSD